MAEKPKALKVLKENIPAELKQVNAWVVWKYIESGARWSKVPFNPNNPAYGASSTNPATWGPFEKAYTAYKQGGFDGLFFSLNGDFSALDLDHCINPDTGEITEYAAGVVKKANTYVELSPSGTGLHLYFKGAFSGDNVKTSAIECYKNKRFMSITGQPFGASVALAEAGPGLESLIKSARALKGPRDNTHKDNATVEIIPQGYDPKAPEEVIETIRAKAPAKELLLFEALFDKGAYDMPPYNGDRSAADMALFDMLLFWTLARYELTLSVFMLSALAKRRAAEDPKKYAREDYWKRTYNTALKTWNGKYYAPEAYKEELKQKTFTLDHIPEGASGGMDWPGFTIRYVGKKPKPVILADSIKNAAYLLKRLGITARYNMISHSIEYTGPGASYTNTAGERINLGAENNRGAAESVLYEAAQVLGWNPPKNIGRFSELLYIVAMDNGYNPACEYLKEAQAAYDGHDYISKFCHMILIQDDFIESAALYQSMIKNWLLWAVKAAFNTLDNAISIENVLVLTGPTNIGKSHFLLALAPFDLRQYVSVDDHQDATDPDGMRFLKNNWLCEIAEADDLTKDSRKSNRIKSFLTRSIDVYRRKWFKQDTKEARTTAFLITTNEKQLIEDTTGAMARRLWVIPVKGFNFPVSDFTFTDKEASWESFKMGLWGQAATLAAKVKAPALTNEEKQLLKVASYQWDDISSTEQAIRDGLDWQAPADQWTYRKCTQLCQELQLPKAQNKQIGRTLTTWIPEIRNVPFDHS